MAETFIFTPVYQQAIIGWMLKEYMFFQECSIHLNESMFPDPKLAEIFRVATNLGIQYKQVPLLEDVKNAIIRLHPKITEHTPRVQTLEICAHIATTQISIAILRDHLVEYIKASITKNAVLGIEPDWKRNNFNAVGDKLDEAVEKRRNVRFANDERVSFTVNQYIQHSSQLREDACTIGNAYFDELIAEGSLRYPSDPADLRNIECTTRGSLMKQELTMIVGPTNAGKTTMVSTVMAWNVKMKKKVLYISLEEKGDRIFRNMFQLICNKSMKEISAGIAENDKKKADADALLQDYFFMYEWFKPADMYIEKLMAFIQSQHERHATHNGKGFDLVVIDYPQHLRSEAMKGSNVPMHTLIANNYIQCKYLANICKFHVIAPIQSNRGGYMASVRGKENRILDGGDVGGSYDSLQIADNVITINRSNEDAQNNRIKFGLVKARNNKKGVTFCSVTNFGVSKTHGPDLPSTVITEGNGEIEPQVLDATLGIGKAVLANNLTGVLHNIPQSNDPLHNFDKKDIKKDVEVITGTRNSAI